MSESLPLACLLILLLSGCSISAAGQDTVGLEPEPPAIEQVAAPDGPAPEPPVVDGDAAPEGPEPKAVADQAARPAPSPAAADPPPKRSLPRPELPGDRHQQLAHEALEVGDVDSAFFHWQRAIVAEPSDLRRGTEYRQAVIDAGSYKECIAFFEALAAEYPEVAAVRLNLGYAYVDKIPVEGAITAVILANKALTEFSAALEHEESWLGYYTRGNSYMYWPAIFNRTELGIADLQRALELADAAPRQNYHGRAWAALGDGYWRLGDREKMLRTWQQGVERYPQTPELEQRLALEGDELDAWLERHFETNTRVATHLREIWRAGDEK